jgi:hypothetical protein
MDDVTLLSRIPDEPRFWLWPRDIAADSVEPMHGWQQARFVVRTVRGRKMRNAQRLFDEFAAALQFPAYFGENCAAFDECLTDLGWLPAGAGHVLVITEPAEVLADDPADFTVLVRILADAVTDWATQELGRPRRMCQTCNNRFASPSPSE